MINNPLEPAIFKGSASFNCFGAGGYRMLQICNSAPNWRNLVKALLFHNLVLVISYHLLISLSLFGIEMD